MLTKLDMAQVYLFDAVGNLPDEAVEEKVDRNIYIAINLIAEVNMQLKMLMEKIDAPKDKEYYAKPILPPSSSK